MKRIFPFSKYYALLNKLFFNKNNLTQEFLSPILKELLLLILILLSHFYLFNQKDKFPLLSTTNMDIFRKKKTIYALWTLSSNFLDDMLPSLFSFIRFHYHEHNLQIYLVSNVTSFLDQKSKVDFLQSSTVNIIFEFFDTSNLPNTSINYPTKEICAIRVLWSEKHPEIKRYLYADGDLIFRSNIADIYYMNFGNNYAIVGPDTYFFKKKIGTSEFVPYYFNSGMIVFNAEMLRRENISQKYLFYYHALQKEFLIYPDQDIMNILFWGHNILLNVSYNEYRNPNYYKSKIYHFYKEKPYGCKRKEKFFKEWNLYCGYIKEKKAPYHIY